MPQTFAALLLVPSDESRKTTARVLRASFGDGYTQRAQDGINSINRVTGFLGPQGRPMPMRDREVNAILNRVEEGQEAPRTLIHFEIGEKVAVTDGPFEGFDGMVEEVDDDNQRLKVTVSIFGRATPVELEYTQVSKEV